MNVSFVLGSVFIKSSFRNPKSAFGYANFFMDDTEFLNN